MVLVEIPLSWIQNVRHFTITNVLANFLILYGLLTCLGFAANNLIESSTTEDNLEDDADNNNEEDQNDVLDIDAEIIAVGPFQNIMKKMSELRPFGPGWFLFIGTSVRFLSIFFLLRCDRRSISSHTLTACMLL